MINFKNKYESNYEKNRLNFIKQIIPESRFINQKALDIGSGIGVFSNILSLKGYKTIGIDISNEKVKTAKSLNKNKINLEFKVEDARNLEYPDNYFDLIL